MCSIFPYRWRGRFCIHGWLSSIRKTRFLYLLGSDWCLEHEAAEPVGSYTKKSGLPYPSYLGSLLTTQTTFVIFIGSIT